MKPRKGKCPICGNYSSEGLGDICPICFCEPGYTPGLGDEGFEEEIESYKKTGMTAGTDPEWVRPPRGIELPGFYEPYNKEAQNDPKFIYTKQCIENEDELFYAADHIVIDDLSELEKKCDNSYKEMSKEEAFKILNALAYKGDTIGLRAAFDLALCYATGCGCKKDLLEAESVLEEIIDYYDITSPDDKFELWKD